MSSGRMQAVARLIEKLLGSTDLSDPKVRKKLKILEGAAELFIAHGYRKTSVDDIAARAAVAKGTVYLYFENKAEILLAAIAREEQQRLSRLEPIFAGDFSAKERLERWLSATLNLATEMPLTAKVLGGDQEIAAALEELPPDLRAQSDDLTRSLARELVHQAAGTHRLTEEELEQRASILAGLVCFTGMLTNQPLQTSLPVSRYAEVMAALIVHGIGGNAPGPAPNRT